MTNNVPEILAAPPQGQPVNAQTAQQQAGDSQAQGLVAAQQVQHQLPSQLQAQLQAQLQNQLFPQLLQLPNQSLFVNQYQLQQLLAFTALQQQLNQPFNGLSLQQLLQVLQPVVNVTQTQSASASAESQNRNSFTKKVKEIFNMSNLFRVVGSIAAIGVTAGLTALGVQSFRGDRVETEKIEFTEKGIQKTRRIKGPNK